jgi:AhpD family alkylhydroperoxidase
MNNSTATATTLSAPGSQAVLNAVAERVGFVPNLFSTMAQQPGVVEAFAALDGAFSESSLTPIERQVVQLAASVENEGRYCIAGHTLFGRSIGMSEQAISAIRSGGKVTDQRLSALHVFTGQLIQSRGHVTAEQIKALLQSGFSRTQMMEIVMGVTVKTFTNYVDSVMHLTLDEKFESAAWTKTGAAID